MHQQTDQRLRQREFLLRISQAMTAELDLTSVLSLVIDVAVELLAGSSGMIALTQADGQLEVRAASRIPQPLWLAFSGLLTTPIHDQAMLRTRMREIANGTGMSIRQMTALPLVFHQTTVGVIYVFRAALNVDFSEEEQELLMSFADQAAIAVSNARLYQRVVYEKQQLDALIEQSADGVMIIDHRWRITTFNRAMEQLTGWSRDEAIGRPCAEVLAIHTSNGKNLCLLDCPLQRKPIDPTPMAEGWIDTRDMRKRYIESRYAVNRNEQDEFVSAIANVRDVTAQKKEVEMQNTFISVISHELRTPVSIIKGYAETLAREDVEWSKETIHEGLQIIIEESDRLAHQIGDLLEVSRIQAGGLRLNPTEWHIRMMVEQVLERFSPHMGTLITTEIRIPDDLPAVYADYERTRTVLENLVSNAVKYSPDGGIIRITARAESPLVWVSVSDQGIGMSHEEQQRLFTRFYRVDNRLSRETQGVGLGLFLSRSIIEAQGGTIRAESQPGRGTRFTFSVPLAVRLLPENTTDTTDSATQLSLV